MGAGKTGGSGLRIVIIAYALGIVFLGAQPLSKRYDGLVDYIDRQTKSLRKADWLVEKLKTLDSIEFKIGEPIIRKPRIPDNSKTQRSQSDNKKPSELDTLSTQDRSELSSLIESVAE